MIQMPERIAETIAGEYLSRLANVLELVPRQPVEQAIGVLLATRSAGRRIYIMGNGGSAATASHIVCDLIKTARVDGVTPLKAFALADNAALITAWANDTSYDRTFAEQIDGLVETGDVVIAISASGNSSNILAGLRAATDRGAQTIAFVGFDGGQASRLADITVHVPSHDYGLVEDSHSALGHAITAAIRCALTAEGQ